MSAVQIKNPLTIVKSGSEPTPVTPKDPYEVYAEERSAEWWPMPANEDVNDNELYLLYHIAKPNDTPYEGESWTFSFQGTGPTITIEYGAMVNGEFVPDPTKTETINVNTSTYSSYTFNMKYADFPANDLANGDRQVMIKISSTGEIRYLSVTASSTTTYTGGLINSIKGLVEFKGKATHIRTLTLGPVVGSGNRSAPRKMVFFSLLGENALTDTSNFFNSAYSLRAVLELDTSSVTNMQQMFGNCRSLVAIPLLNTSLVSGMLQMFLSCSSLETIPLLDTSSVTGMTSMFNGCHSLTTIPLLNTSSVSSFQETFAYCYSLKTIPPLDTSSAMNTIGMFSECRSLEEIPLLDVSSVTNLRQMFLNCYSLKTIPLLDTSSATNMDSMFNGCFSLITIPLLDTSSVTNMSSMFNNCPALKTIPLLDTSSVTNMQQMFGNCRSLETVPLLDTSLVTSMYSMFNYCDILQTIPQFDTSSVTNISSFLSNCTSLQTVPQFDTSSVTTVQNMLASSHSLQFADLSNYDLTSVTSTSYQNLITQTGYGCVIKIDPTKNVPVAGLSRAFIIPQGSSANPSFILIEDENTMFPILANATTVFGTNQYVYVVVPDSMYETYAADQYWATLGSRLIKRSEATLPSWYTGA